MKLKVRQETDGLQIILRAGDKGRKE